MEMVDLTNCDREPIHIPGKIQDHGFMIALDQNLTITHCSDNVVHFLHIEAEKLLGKSVSILEEIISPNRDPFINELITDGHDREGICSPESIPGLLFKIQVTIYSLAVREIFIYLNLSPRFQISKKIFSHSSVLPFRKCWPMQIWSNCCSIQPGK